MYLRCCRALWNLFLEQLFINKGVITCLFASIHLHTPRARPQHLTSANLLSLRPDISTPVIAPPLHPSPCPSSLPLSRRIALNHIHLRRCALLPVPAFLRPPSLFVIYFLSFTQPPPPFASSCSAVSSTSPPFFFFHHFQSLPTQPCYSLFVFHLASLTPSATSTTATTAAATSPSLPLSHQSIMKIACYLEWIMGVRRGPR